ncbi:hypothetical protein AcetOrient_orf03109 [Acetobacter orientalis]|uniref:Uncharacterized protein n=1 Tax=Acetobacter orientalis TaxID=146474 RepID=A0A2Z5ZIV0_9PROT|nr:hypothetical protein AcetOrient_orf03109 [Acetobacter orientalis]
MIGAKGVMTKECLALSRSVREQMSGHSIMRAGMPQQGAA